MDGQLDTPVSYELEPRVCFLADAMLDFALVAVADPQGTLGTFGFHPLVAEDAAAIVGETLSVIEHPGAEPKQVALRGCREVVGKRREYPRPGFHQQHARREHLCNVAMAG